MRLVPKTLRISSSYVKALQVICMSKRCKIIANDAQAEAVKVLPKKLAVCCKLLEQLISKVSK